MSKVLEAFRHYITVEKKFKIFDIQAQVKESKDFEYYCKQSKRLTKVKSVLYLQKTDAIQPHFPEQDNQAFLANGMALTFDDQNVTLKEIKDFFDQIVEGVIKHQAPCGVSCPCRDCKNKMPCGTSFYSMSKETASKKGFKIGDELLIQGQKMKVLSHAQAKALGYVN